MRRQHVTSGKVDRLVLGLVNTTTLDLHLVDMVAVPGCIVHRY